MKLALPLLAMILAAAPARAAEVPATATPDTLERVVPLPEVVVSTTRAGDRAPLARSVLGRAELVERNLGEDTPMLLATLPGAYAYSDAGNGIGYSYLSIRGFPQRRISVLIDGVPLNDPESHEVYWIDHPDLLASTAEAQVQRGVGSALYGAASVGGSVNLETAPFSETPRASAVVAYGSYETKRLMLEMNSGRLAGGWSLYGRYSRIESFGYRDQSGSRLWSYDLSARRRFGRQSLRLNLFGGPEETHLAYLGVPEPYLDGEISGDRDRDRRFNPLTYPNERDHFFEPHYELVHSWAPGRRLSLTQTLFYFDGKGYYDEQRFGQSLTDYRLSPWFTADTLLYSSDYFARDTSGRLIRDANGRLELERFDLVRRRTIVDRHYGWIPRARIEHARGAITIGGEIRGHDGRHYGEVIAGDGLPPGTGPDHTYYDYHPRTLSAGLFARDELQLRSDVLATLDLAWRHEGYFMRGDRFDGVRFDQPYDFALPRVGVTWAPRPSLSAFAAWSSASREPAFRDLYDGEGSGGAPLYRRNASGGLDAGAPLIRPEKVNDVEIGAAWRTDDWSLTSNLFRMDFRDELVYAGQFDTDLGYPILGNAAESVHQGIELAGRARHRIGGGPSVTIDANATFGDNHFVRYREIDGTNPGDTLVYDHKAIGFFPAALGNVSAAAEWKALRVGADAQYAGRIYVDNTETRSASIDPRTVVNVNGSLRFPWGGSAVEIGLHVLNLFDKEYATSGYMDYDAAGNLVPQLMPAATRHWLAQARVEF